VELTGFAFRGESAGVKHGLILAMHLDSAEGGDALLRDVGGVKLLLRQARLLRVVGVGPITVLVPEDCHAAAEGALGGWLQLEEISLIGARHAGNAVELALAALHGAPQGTLVLDARWVHERKVVQAMCASEGDTESCFGVDMDCAGDGLLAVGSVPPAAFEAWLRSVIAGETVACEVERWGPRFESGDCVGRVEDESSRAATESALWEGCRKATDGYVSRGFNRHVSLFVSRRIVKWRISPNQITVFNLLFGIAGAWFALQGTYADVLIGAALLQLNSVLDGVDGELARMRIQSSVMGEWLDTVSDDIANQGFFACLALGAWQRTGSEQWLWLGGATVLPLMATSAYYYLWCWRHGRGDILAFDWFDAAQPVGPQSLGARVMGVLTVLFRRDSFVMMLLIAAALGVTHHALWITAPAALVTCATLWLRKAPEESA